MRNNNYKHEMSFKKETEKLNRQLRENSKQLQDWIEETKLKEEEK